MTPWLFWCIENNFDDRFANYIIEGKVKSSYYISISLDATSQNLLNDDQPNWYDYFLSFLKKVKERKIFVNFHKIRFCHVPKDTGVLNDIILTLNSLGYHKSIVESSDFWLLYGSNLETISYIGRISNSENLTKTTEWGTLVIDSKMLDLISEQSVTWTANAVHLTKNLKFRADMESGSYCISGKLNLFDN